MLVAESKLWYNYLDIILEPSEINVWNSLVLNNRHIEQQHTTEMILLCSIKLLEASYPTGCRVWPLSSLRSSVFTLDYSLFKIYPIPIWLHFVEKKIAVKVHRLSLVRSLIRRGVALEWIVESFLPPLGRRVHRHMYRRLCKHPFSVPAIKLYLSFLPGGATSRSPHLFFLPCPCSIFRAATSTSLALLERKVAPCLSSWRVLMSL